MENKKVFPYILVVTFIFVNITLLNAQNLVPNPSFETYTTCPSTYGQIPLVAWQKPVGHTGSADYFNTCAGGGLGVPNNTFGNQMPATGNGYCGIITYHYSGNFREYLQVQLTQTLIAGQCYDICLKWSTAENYPRYSSNNLGVHLSNAAITGPGNAPINVVPQILSPVGTLLEDKTNWQTLCGTYTASGGEQWITIGNFYNDAATTLNTTYTPTASFNAAYYFIDDVSVVLNPCISGAIGDTICNGDQAMIHANGGSAYNWYQSGNPGVSLGTNDTLFVSPSTTTTYVVTIDGTNDTVDVVVHPTYSSNVNTTICQGDSVLLEGAYQTTSGIYNDTLYTVNGCDSIIITNLTVNPVPVNNVNASICQNDSIFLAGAYQNTTGIYNDTITNGAANGCDSIIITNLTVNQFVTGNANAQICQGDSILLGGAYQITAGNYNDTIVGGSVNGCDSIVITNLSIIPTSMGNANARICDNDSILIGNTYYSSAGVYPYTIPNGSASGCDSTVNVTLTVDYAFSNHQDLIICQGDSVLVGGQYVSKFGFNQVSYQSINGCDSTYTATISFIPQYDFYLPEDTTLCMGQTFILSPYINSTYYNLMWENGSTNQYREIDTSGTYIMTYSHKSCDHQGNDEINVLFENCDFFIYVPNTFTPDKDGLNDGFAPVIYGEFTEYSFRIFDRWGEVIFESSTHGESWKGTYKNELVKTDVYVWKLIVKPKKDKEITQTGKVTILK
jgi:gliding motility-associated-like protein